MVTFQSKNSTLRFLTLSSIFGSGFERSLASLCFLVEISWSSVILGEFSFVCFEVNLIEFNRYEFLWRMNFKHACASIFMETEFYAYMYVSEVLYTHPVKQRQQYHVI